MKKFEEKNQKHPSGRPQRETEKRRYSLHVPESSEPLTVGLRKTTTSAIGFIHKFPEEECSD